MSILIWVNILIDFLIVDDHSGIAQRRSSKTIVRKQPSLEMTKEGFLKEYEAKLKEIKAKYDNKLEYLRQKYSGMDLSYFA